MSLITTISLSSPLSKKIIDHCENILHYENKFILPNNDSSILNDMDINDPTLPGINDDFILNKEYEKFRVIQDQKYISSMDEFYSKYLNENSYNE